MALYALYIDELISAADAAEKGNYRCLECKGPMQVRKGRRRRHFYHVKTSPSCRLYSKSEDHLILQHQIQSLFPEREIILEKPFLSLGRVADACFDKCKLIFEIQCSPISEKEAKNRIQDYGSLGYSVIWLLDDRLFNRKSASSAEMFLRQSNGYFVRYQRLKSSFFYDQFEILQNQKRLKKGSQLPILLNRPRILPKIPDCPLPEQIKSRFQTNRLFFEGDLCHKALLSSRSRSLAIAMQNWIFLENQTAASKKLFPAYSKKILRPFYFFFDWLLGQLNS